MTARGFYTLTFGVVMLTTALSVGSGGAFVLGAAALCALALALATTLLSFFSLRVTQTLDEQCVRRGEACVYTLAVRMLSLPGAAPLALRIALPGGRQSEFRLEPALVGETVSRSRFSCPHVGVHPVGVVSVRVGDCFSLFALSRRVNAPQIPVTVLPNPIQTPALTFRAGEGEANAVERAQADPTTPSDTRLWQEGDELKRVHWKLSMRKQQLMVHTYDRNPRPDALVLLDCAAPDAPDNRRAAAIDRMTETCAGVVQALLEAGHAVRLPLGGGQDAGGAGTQALGGVLRALAAQPFDGPQEFSRMLMLSSRRMERTGSAAILTTRLTPRVADDVIALSRMGPHIVFYLIAAKELTTQETQLLQLLTVSGVEPRHIPA